MRVTVFATAFVALVAPLIIAQSESGESSILLFSTINMHCSAAIVLQDKQLLTSNHTAIKGSPIVVVGEHVEAKHHQVSGNILNHDKKVLASYQPSTLIVEKRASWTPSIGFCGPPGMFCAPGAAEANAANVVEERAPVITGDPTIGFCGPPGMFCAPGAAVANPDKVKEKRVPSDTYTAIIGFCGPMGMFCGASTMVDMQFYDFGFADVTPCGMLYSVVQQDFIDCGLDYHSKCHLDCYRNHYHDCMNGATVGFEDEKEGLDTGDHVI